MSARWNVVGASVRGASHFKTRTACQDACAYMVMQSGILLAVVSDGAGSAARSELGAGQAVKRAVQTLFSELTGSVPETHRAWGRLLHRSFSNAREKVLELAQQEDRLARDYACTLSIVLADHEWLAAGQLGDGLAVAMTADSELHTIGEPQRGEYADSTYFVTDEGAPEAFFGRVYRQGVDIEPVRALAVMTDGLTNLAIDRHSRRPHAPFFEPLMQVPAGMKNHETALAELQAFLTSERVNSRTGDDKTLVLAGRPGSD